MNIINLRLPYGVRS